MWQPGRDAAELTANGLDRKSKNGHGERCQHEGNDRAWDALSESWEQQNDQERTDAKQQCGPLGASEAIRQQAHAQYELAWYRRGLEAQEVFNLCRSDEDGNAIREANGDRARNVFTAVPKPVTAMSMRITPAIMVTISRPETPWAVMMPATMTTNAPVGPPI
jgi:hypothetical protein